MDIYVERWQNGKYCVLLSGIGNGGLSYENKSDGQYLYRINYEKYTE